MATGKGLLSVTFCYLFYDWAFPASTLALPVKNQRVIIAEFIKVTG